MTTLDMTALVEWRGKPDVHAPGSSAGTGPIVVHAVVAGDLLTLCGLHVVSQLLPALPSDPAVEVCPACVDITVQLAAGLLTHVHQDRPNGG